MSINFDKVDYWVADFLGKLRKTIGKRFPDSEDLHGAVDALIRLQDLYELTTDQVASGQLYTDIEQPVSMKCKFDVNFLDIS